MPSSPSLPGATTISTSSRKTARSAVMTSSCNTATASPPESIFVGEPLGARRLPSRRVGDSVEPAGFDVQRGALLKRNPDQLAQRKTLPGPRALAHRLYRPAEAALQTCTLAPGKPQPAAVLHEACRRHPGGRWVGHGGAPSVSEPSDRAVVVEEDKDGDPRRAGARGGEGPPPDQGGP